MVPSGGSPALSEIISRSLGQIRKREAPATGQRNAGEECEFEIAPGVKMVMCWIPPGEFLMGSPEEYETQHRVMITQGFWLAKTPTTQAQWQAVMGSNPSHFQGRDLPVEQVSWIDICVNESGTLGFLRELNKRVPTGGLFNLPTEAQWEYACRAGTTGPYVGNLDEMGWHDANSDGKTHPVGQKKPNAWGLHETYGNVFEWCSDWYGDYDVINVTDPKGPASGTDRVIRGCYWGYAAYYCRVAYRRYYGPAHFNNDGLGFRVARSSVP